MVDRSSRLTLGPMLVALAFAGASLWLLRPFLPWLVLAAWFARLCRPLFQRALGILGGRATAGAALTLALLSILLFPLGLMLLSLGRSAAHLVEAVMQSENGRAAFEALVSKGGGESPLDGLPTDPSQALELLKAQGANAYRVLSAIAGATASGALGIFVFLLGIYTFLVQGDALAEWIYRHSPLRRDHTERLGAAFHEAGQGLLVGMGLTGLTQALLATVTYFALGVPRALVLGALTFFAALVPAVGTALVWVPVALGLAFDGRTMAALVMAGVGIGVIGMVDNVVRPIFSRMGKLETPTFVLLLGIFGGLTLWGGWGVFLGPLLLRLTQEALRLLEEERRASGSDGP
jgi:predicted PurR-regulated permease PerM